MIAAARFPARHLPILASLRTRNDVRCFVQSDNLWVLWPSVNNDIATLLRPIPGVEFFERRAAQWYRSGKRIPSEAFPPAGEGVLIASLLAPARFTPDTNVPLLHNRLSVGLVPCAVVRPASALSCDLSQLTTWIEQATSNEIQAVKAAFCENEVIVVGDRLPVIPQANRFWGTRLFKPLGYMTTADLPEELILSALRASDDEWAFLHDDRIAIVPRAVFRTLTRAGVRQVSI